jgi:hypothetical protein
MKKKTKLEFIKSQTIKYIELSKEVLDQVINSEEVKVLTEDTISGDENIRVLDSYQIKLNNIEEEKKKINQIHYYISVIGQIKSGKSTLISSIVGEYITPIRDSPMTIIPTIITHDKDKKQSELILPNYGIYNELIKFLEKKFENLEEDNQIFKIYYDLMIIYKKIKGKKYLIKEKYQGFVQIYEVIMEINDMIRASYLRDIVKDGEYDILKEFKTLDDFPRILMKFSDLEGIDSTGTLSIIDSPGPDEFLISDHLKNIVKIISEKSSSILLAIRHDKTESIDSYNFIKEYISNNEKLKLFVAITRCDEIENDNSKEEKLLKKKLKIQENIFENNNIQVENKNIFTVSASRGFWKKGWEKIVEEYKENDDAIINNKILKKWLKDMLDTFFGEKDHLKDFINIKTLDPMIREELEEEFQNSLVNNVIDIVLKDIFRKIFWNCIKSGIKNYSVCIKEISTRIQRQYLYCIEEKETKIQKLSKILKKNLPKVISKN